MQLIQLFLDFGMVILIWMTQLIVYPGFNFYQEKDLILWHEKYTFRVSFLVIPQMSGQLIIHGYGLLVDINLFMVLNFLMVLALWTINIWSGLTSS